MESTQSAAANSEVLFETLESKFRQLKANLTRQTKCRLLIELAEVHANLCNAYGGSHQPWIASKIFGGYSLQ